ncbi:MAG: GntR family transcriptional regulator [Polyangiaceae bacterium]
MSRRLAADPVFEALAGAILRGDHPPGSALPTERELAETFHVSRLIARQAMHRLRDLGLVRGGQGGHNVVLDPANANDLRITALQLELAPETADDGAVFERQLLGGVVLLALAQHRITSAELDELDAMITRAEPDADGLDAEFWLFLATTARNEVLLREARFWFELLGAKPERRRPFNDRPELRLAVYRQLVEELRRPEGQAAEVFLRTIRPLIQARA